MKASQACGLNVQGEGATPWRSISARVALSSEAGAALADAHAARYKLYVPVDGLNGITAAGSAPAPAWGRECVARERGKSMKRHAGDGARTIGGGLVPKLSGAPLLEERARGVVLARCGRAARLLQ